MHYALPLDSMPTAIYPGSFDPMTIGHLHLIDRAAALFERLIVVVGYNPNKQTAFTLEERLAFVGAATAHLPNVTADSFTQELLVSYARRVGATIVVRGLRSAQDYTNEWTQAQMNRRMFPQLDTVFLFAADEDRDISSTRVRAALRNGDPITDLVPPSIVPLIEQKQG
jgi:pantetheine-phosphate adenylyltransferase